MEPSQPTDQSFIIRIWLEETAVEANETTWRGKITHVSSGDYRYFEDLSVVADFIDVYVQRMGRDALV